MIDSLTHSEVLQSTVYRINSIQAELRKLGR